MSVMCSHESIAWKITDNSVTDRMIDNSLIHKFRPSRKLRRRTKVLNTEMKKHYGMTDYKHYVELKTNVLRNLANDTDTDDNSSLTDVDYNIIYSSPSKQAKYVAENSKRHIFSSEEDCKGCKRKSIKYQMESRDSRTNRHAQTRKSSRMKYSILVSKKHTNVGWQEVTKKNSIIPYLRKQVHISDNEEKDNDCSNFKAQSSKRSLSSRLDSPNSTTSIKNYGNGYMRQNHESNAMDNKLNFENSTMSTEIKSVTEKKIQNHRNQSATRTESSILVKSKDNSSNKLTAISNRSSIRNYDNKNINHKTELLKNVKRNLIPTLEKVDSINDKDIEINENTEDGLNCDQLLSASNVNFNRDTTLKKTQTDIPTIKNVSLDTSPLDQQKDSGIDEDSQDRFVKIKESNEIATNHSMEENAEKILIFSPELKSDEVIETAQDCEEDEKDAHSKYSNDILIDQTSKESSGEEKMKNSSQLNQIDLNVEINQEDKEDEYFARTEDSNDLQKQQSLSPKQNCIKDTHSEFYNHVQEEEGERKMQNSSEEEEISLQLTVSSINSKDTEVSSINRGGEDEKQVSNEKEEKDFSQLNEADKDVKTHSINQENKIYMKLENTHNVEKKQILPKVMYTEVLSKKYKIIKKDNDVKSNETIDNINNNTDVANKDTPIKRNTSLCYSDISYYDTDNWQETTEEIDASITLETDNEEINMNYISPQTKKRLQQQARLNLVENSDSSDSDDECITTKSSQKFIDNADTNRCSENDILKNDETNSDCKQTNSYVPIKNTLISTEVVKLDSTNVKDGIKKKAESLRYKNNDLFQFTTNENPLKETQCYGKVHNNDRNEDDSFQLKVSESNVSYNNEESINQCHNHKHSPLSNKKYMYTESNENEEIVRAEYEHNAQASTKSRSTAHINISCQYRPSNLQELVEDQELLVETMPASFTLADLSEDEEAFILNVPSKVVQCNLQGQVLTLKEKSIKFNENKYRIVQKEVGTTSCIFATGKKRKPYKIINVKQISTITVREKLPQDSKNRDVSYSYSAVSSVKIEK